MKNYFAGNLSFLRKKNGWSIPDVASKLAASANLLEQLEDNKATPDLISLLKFSETFGLTIDQLVKIDLAQSMRVNPDLNIKLLVLDVDGVLTDGGMYYTESGDEFKKFNVKDGRALKNLSEKGFEIGIISSGFNSNIIFNRAKLFDIKLVHVGTEAKLDMLQKWTDELKIDMTQVAFVGDDINDMDVLEVVGLSACPADAHSKVKAIVDVVLSKKGGKGCVREFVENYISEI